MPGHTDSSARRSRVTTSGIALETGAAFFCVAKCHWMKSDHMGLILGRSPRFPGYMERVGSISNVPKDWYDTGVDATITII